MYNQLLYLYALLLLVAVGSLISQLNHWKGRAVIYVSTDGATRWTRGAETFRFAKWQPAQPGPMGVGRSELVQNAIQSYPAASLGWMSTGDL